MTPEFWLQNWQAHKIGFHQAETNSYLRSFWQQLNLANDSRVFVPLCGKSLDLLWLCQQGHSVIGVELSPLAVSDFFAEHELAHTQFAQDCFECREAERLTLLQGDFFNLLPEHVEEVAGVFDRASLVALPIELRQQYVQHLKRILPDNAKILLVSFEYDQAEMPGPPFSVTEAEVHALYQDVYTIECLLQQDILKDNPQFRARGLTRLQEKVFLLQHA
ncbi:MAG: thiopurine S-methyltransferase [Methylococcaceae bacterium]|nr:thiopurine S-methyltransferase [Methylococcaceae bacterium]